MELGKDDDAQVRRYNSFIWYTLHLYFDICVCNKNRLSRHVVRRCHRFVNGTQCSASRRFVTIFSSSSSTSSSSSLTTLRWFSEVNSKTGDEENGLENDKAKETETEATVEEPEVETTTEVKDKEPVNASDDAETDEDKEEEEPPRRRRFTNAEIDAMDNDTFLWGLRTERQQAVNTHNDWIRSTTPLPRCFRDRDVIEKVLDESGLNLEQIEVSVPPLQEQQQLLHQRMTIATESFSNVCVFPVFCTHVHSLSLSLCLCRFHHCRKGRVMLTAS